MSDKDQQDQNFVTAMTTIQEDFFSPPDSMHLLGWRMDRNGDGSITIQKNEVGGFVATDTAEHASHIAPVILHALASDLMASSPEVQMDALRDMLTDTRVELDMLREALGVTIEPHQSKSERMLQVAREAAGAQAHKFFLLTELRRVNDLCLSEIGQGLVDPRAFELNDSACLDAAIKAASEG